MDVDAEFQAALAAHRAGQVAEAERLYGRIVAAHDHPPSLHNLGLIRHETGRTGEAEAFYRRAAEAAPDEPRRHFALAVHLRTTRQLAAAEAAYRRTLELAPDYPMAAFDLGCVLIAAGRFEEGWALYERRAARDRMHARAPGCPEWTGEPLAGKRLLVWNEQGYGDQIMMARFLSRLDAAQVTYAGRAPLERLFAPLPVRFTPPDPAILQGGDFDFWTLPLSLPHRLGVTVQTVPAAPYLFGDPRAGGGRIGVVTHGDAANANDRFRSLSADEGAALLALPGAVSLDPADTGAADFQDTADLVAGLDLVITVDTAAAHLAGALGKPVWVLLSRFALDWHWPRQGASPWYPSARLFAQAAPGDWAPVIREIVRELGGG